jgi:hypothetical protein
MKTTRISLSVAAVLCVFVLWPAEASATYSFRLSIGSHIGLACASRPHHTYHEARRTTYIGIDRHRRLLGCPPVRRCASGGKYLLPYRPIYYSSVSTWPRPACRVVNVYREPARRVRRYPIQPCVQKTRTRKIDVIRR